MNKIKESWSAAIKAKAERWDAAIKDLDNSTPTGEAAMETKKGGSMINNTNETRCALCGLIEKGLYTHRPIFLASDGIPQHGFYRPRLSPDEVYLLSKRKEIYICVQRMACKTRRLKNGEIE